MNIGPGHIWIVIAVVAALEPEIVSVLVDPMLELYALGRIDVNGLVISSLR